MSTAEVRAGQQQQLASTSVLAGPSQHMAAATGSRQVAQQPQTAPISIQRVEHTLQTLAPSLAPQSLLPAPAVQAFQTALSTLTAPVLIAMHVAQPWKWQKHRIPASVARVTLRNNFVALSAVCVLWYLGAWDLLWEGVRRTAGDGAQMVLQRLILFSLVANIAESAYTLSYPAPLPAPIGDTVPTYKPMSLSPAHRRLIERTLQDLPPPSSSPFSSPTKLSPSVSRSISPSGSLSRSSTTPLSASRLASSSFSRSNSSLASTLRRDDSLRDPLNPDNPESPLRAFGGRHSPKAGRALGAGDVERMRRERW